MQEHSYSQLHVQLTTFISNKKFSEAEELLKSMEGDERIVRLLSDLHSQLQYQNEDEYEQMLLLFCLMLNPSVQYGSYRDAVSNILEQIVAISSAKYSLVLLRSFLFRVEQHKFSKFIVLSHLYLYASLLFDPTLEDINSLYSQFIQLSHEFVRTQKEGMDSQVSKFSDLSLQSHEKILSNCMDCQYQLHQKRVSLVLEFLSKIINEVYQLKNSQQGIENMCLCLLAKFDVTVQKETLPLFFANAVYQHSCPMILAQNSLNSILLKSLCLELPSSLTSPPVISQIGSRLIFSFLKILTLFLKRNTQTSNHTFLIQHFQLVSELIQKVNILMGCIDPTQEAYKFLSKQFLSLDFLTPQQRQQILGKMIARHTNVGFKTHLLTYYRKLLTFKTSKQIWLHSIPILLKELQHIEPNTSLDYIGHVLSLAYYWKAVTSKFLSQTAFKPKLHINIDQPLQQFTSKLTSLKKGLETRSQLLGADKEQERNQIGVCLFRIQELTSTNQTYQTKVV